MTADENPRLRFVEAQIACQQILEAATLLYWVHTEENRALIEMKRRDLEKEFGKLACALGYRVERTVPAEQVAS